MFNRFCARLWRRSLFAFFDLKALISRIGSRRRLDYVGADLSIHVDNVREYETRARSVTKEPGTVAWMEERRSKGAVLYDIGANIGAYSLVAASNGYRVVAIEPAYQNFYQLNRNISLNGYDESIVALNIALGAEDDLVNFKFLDVSTGTSKCYYNKNDNYHLEGPVVLEKPLMCFSLDNLVSSLNLPLPNLIKVDVDGGEQEVLVGAERILRESAVQSVIVEIDERFTEPLELTSFLYRSGLVEVKRHKLEPTISNYVFDRR